MFFLLIFALQMCSTIKGDIPHAVPTRDYVRLLNAEEAKNASPAGQPSQESQFFDKLLNKAVLGYKLDPANLPNYTIKSTIWLLPVVTTFYNSAICGLSTVKRSGTNFIKAGENGTKVRLSLATDQLLLRVYANVSALFMKCSMKILVQVSTVSLLVQLTEKRIGQLMVKKFEVKLQKVKMEFTEIGHSTIYSKAKSFLEEKIKTFTNR
uniref:Putative secreted protein n=1 Tax=Ixodes ricinus TaxID=34613 RepID=A0A090X9M0_IXORI